MFRRLALLTLALAGIASPAAAARPVLYAKPATGLEPTRAAAAVCEAEARGVKAPSVTTPAYTPNAYAAAGAALATGFIQGMQEAKARNAYMDSCMRAQGFAKLELTQPEEAELAAQKGDAAREAWLSAFLAKDWSARITAALTPAVAPFPDARLEPFVVGGARLDPTKLTVTPGPVALKQPLLSGPLQYRRTARLTSDFRVANILDQRAETGAIFHQVRYAQGRAGFGPTYWCGPVANNSIRGRINQPLCITADFDGYTVIPTTGQPWMASQTLLTQTLVSKVKSGALALDEASPSEPADLRMELVATSFTKAGVFLDARALHDGKPVVFWSGFVGLDAQGHGQLPFWTHVLDLQRSDKTLTATLTDKGDGRGWEEPRAAGGEPAR